MISLSHHSTPVLVHLAKGIICEDSFSPLDQGVQNHSTSNFSNSIYCELSASTEHTSWNVTWTPWSPYGYIARICMPCMSQVFWNMSWWFEGVLYGKVIMKVVIENETGQKVANLNGILSIFLIISSLLTNYTKILSWEELVLLSALSFPYLHYSYSMQASLPVDFFFFF